MLVKRGDDLKAVSFCCCWCSFTLKGLPPAPAPYFICLFVSFIFSFVLPVFVYFYFYLILFFCGWWDSKYCVRNCVEKSSNHFYTKSVCFCFSFVVCCLFLSVCLFLTLRQTHRLTLLPYAACITVLTDWQGFNSPPSLSVWTCGFGWPF